MEAIIIIVIIIVIVIFLTLSTIAVVNTGKVFVVERFGQYHKSLSPGFHFITPLISRVVRKISTKQQILDILPQTVITKDNVNISIDNVIFYKVMDAQAAVYNIENYKEGIIYSTITNMRNIVGEMTLDEVLSGRDRINKTLLNIIDEVTDAYGIKILSVEIKNINPPAEIQQAMEKQMKAERNKRAVILEAEGEKQSQIEKAEGEKQSNIRRAEGLKESQLLEAEGEAKAIEEIAKANASAIMQVNRAIIESGTDERVIAIKQVEALIEMAKNPANKLILPNETISSLGSLAAAVEILKETKK